MIASRSNESWSWRFVGGRSINLLVSYPTYARPVSSLHARAYLFIREKQECPRTGTTGEAIGFTSRRFYLRSFWVIYTSFDVIPLMLGQHQQRDTPPFSFPCGLLQFFLCWCVAPFLGLCGKFQSQFRSHARLILFVGRVGGGIWPRVKLLIKSTGPWRKLTRSILLTPLVSSLLTCCCYSFVSSPARRLST